MFNFIFGMLLNTSIFYLNEEKEGHSKQNSFNCS